MFRNSTQPVAATEPAPAPEPDAPVDTAGVPGGGETRHG